MSATIMGVTRYRFFQRASDLDQRWIVRQIHGLRDKRVLFNHCRTEKLLCSRVLERPMTDLTSKKCVPCEGGAQPLKGEALKAYREQTPDWQVVEDHHLYRKFPFKDFKQALEFVNKVGAIAEQEGHHPNITFTWGKVEITIYTHSIGGLSENDFILAAKIDQTI